MAYMREGNGEEAREEKEVRKTELFIDNVIKSYPDIPKPNALFNIQNVADYFYGAESDMYIDFASDIFSYFPPFAVTWFEYKFPAVTRTEGGLYKTPIELIGVPFGILAISEKKDNRVDVDFYVFSISANSCEKFYARKFVCDLKGKFIGDKIKKDDNGKIFLPTWVSEKISSIIPRDLVHKMFLSLSPVLIALNFLHCKNVLMQENYISKKLIKANIKRGKPRPYFEKYYTLAIEPMKKILNTEGQAQTLGLKKSFHICRGHFKTYDVNPLFGKVKGTFWIPAHTKGDIKKGIIKKDYSM